MRTEMEEWEMEPTRPPSFPANGVNGVDGSYARPALSTRAVAELARAAPVDRDHVHEAVCEVARRRAGQREPVDGRSRFDLAEAGWGIIFSHTADPAVREALGDLLSLRRDQAGDSFAEFHDDTAYRAGQTKFDFLYRARSGPGAVDPRVVPYYLLVVGSPEEIPFRFQYQLGIRHAVGRLDLDRPEDYFNYARSVIRSEHLARSVLSRDLALFAPAHEGDELTALSSEVLAGELGRSMESEAKPPRTVQYVCGEHATKQRLRLLLGGQDRPAVLFSATHGITCANGAAHRRARQGALLCQDWPGPRHKGPTSEEWFFAAEDLEDDTDLTGMVIFNFACYSAGTYVHWKPEDMVPLSSNERPFTAALAQRMLSLPKGAVAVVGHVDEVWWHSFLWRGLTWPQAYEQGLNRLLRGERLGWAMEPFRRRYAELSSDLNDLREFDEMGLAAGNTDQQLAELWTATVDARGFIVLGDPAVRLPGSEVGL